MPTLSIRVVIIIMVGIVAMIDSAIFILTGPAIGLACNALKLEFIVSATITLLTAMACTELGLTMQQAAGGYNISG
jgi:amino acid transporter